jgi:tight adherence protein B
MFTLALDSATLLMSASVFGLVLALWSIGVVIWARRRAMLEMRIEERLAATAGPGSRAKTLRLWHEGREATTTVPGGTQKARFSERLEQARKDAGLAISIEAAAGLVLLSVVATFLCIWVLSGLVVPAILGAAAILLVWWWYFSVRLANQRSLFERQLVDGLELSARALRAGHPLYGAFELIAEEIPPPLGTVFREICQQQAMGVRLEDSLRRAALLSNSPDMKLFSAALSIQLKSGGNLAEVMEGLAFVIRERMRLNRRFRVLIAQTQFSKRVLLILPFFMFTLMNFINPEYVNTLYATSAGNWMLISACVSLMLGWLVMNKMANLRA